MSKTFYIDPQYPIIPFEKPLTPPSGSGIKSYSGGICISDSYLPYVRLALESAVYPISWFGAENQVQNVIYEFTRIIELIGVCSGGKVMIIRQKPSNDCVMQYSIDNGDSWIDGFDFNKCMRSGDITLINNTINDIKNITEYHDTTYNGTATSIAPIAQDYTDIPNNNMRDMALCNAWFTFLSVYNGDLTERLSKSKTVINDVFQFLNDVALGLTGIIAFVASITYGPIGAAIAALAFSIAKENNEHFKDNPLFTPETLLLTESELSELACCLSTFMAGSMLTELSFKNAIADANCGIINNDQESALINVTQSNEAYLNFISIQQSAYGSLLDGISDYCLCDTQNQLITIDFEYPENVFVGGGAYSLPAFSGESPRVFIPSYVISGAPIGSSKSSIGDSLISYSGNYWSGCFVRVDLQQIATITNINYTWRFNITADNNNREVFRIVKLYDSMGSLLHTFTIDNTVAQNINHIQYFAGNIPNVAYLWVYVRRNSVFSSGTAGEYYIDNINITTG